jgi:hypothetical protein
LALAAVIAEASFVPLYEGGVLCRRFKQTTEALCKGLGAAWRFFGGVTRRAVLDNTTAVILRASAKAPTIFSAFAPIV